MVASLPPSLETVEQVEHVVLVNAEGEPIGRLPKALTHHGRTPLHLGFSCYLLDDEGRLLLTRRAHDKATFPGVWTNSFCGHPAPGEPVAYAARRRAQVELGATLGWVRLVLPEFRYRAEMDGVVEHELCPVVVAGLADGGRLDPDTREIDGLEWIEWDHFTAQVSTGRFVVSPWCAEQVAELTALGPDPLQWPEADPARLPAALRPPHTPTA